jgi:hypothetical protein
MPAHSEMTTLIQRLSSLSQLLNEDNQGARKEALQLSKRLTATLEDPVNIAIDLAFAVRVTCRPSRFRNLSGYKTAINLHERESSS